MAEPDEENAMTATIRRIAFGGAAVVLALGVSAGLYASAQNTNQDPPPFRGGPGGPGRAGGPGRWGGPGGPMGMLPMFGREIGLTDAQRDQIKAIADSHKDEWKTLADRARTAHDALNDAVTADTIDDALIRQKSAEVATVDADMAVARAHAHAEVLQILTADQRAQIKKRQAEMKDRMKNHQDGRGGRLLDRFGL
jgi:Spy/CpxP family protein refolding chaperone